MEKRLSRAQKETLSFFCSCPGWRRGIPVRISARSIYALVRKGLLKKKLVPYKDDTRSFKVMWTPTAEGRRRFK